MSEASEGYWVVIPAYNEEATVRDVAMRARRHCAHVIVVDDGSTDGTTRALAGLDVILLRNEQNRGKAGSLIRGFTHALSLGAVGVITLDADGQHAPEEIPLFLNAVTKHPDTLLIGARNRERRQASRWRYSANCIADFWIGWAAGMPMEDSQSGFRLYPARILTEVEVPHGPTRSFVYESEMAIEAARRGFTCATLTVSVSPRPGPCPSHFRPLVDILRITRMVAWKLLTRGMYLHGLVRSMTARTGAGAWRRSSALGSRR